MLESYDSTIELRFNGTTVYESFYHRSTHHLIILNIISGSTLTVEVQYMKIVSSLSMFYNSNKLNSTDHKKLPGGGGGGNSQRRPGIHVFPR